MFWNVHVNSEILRLIPDFYVTNSVTHLLLPGMLKFSVKETNVICEVEMK